MSHLPRIPTRRADLDCVAELDWRHAPITLPEGLSIQWLGTAGFAVRAGDVTILIDPYVSRLSLRDLARSGALTPRSDLLGSIPVADAILVGHTHFDHALDVPALAHRNGCRTYGSTSLQHLMALHGRADASVVVTPHQTYEIGPFRVTFVPSRHSKLLLGVRVPADGELTCDCLDNLGTGAYRCGQVWGIHLDIDGYRIYHQGSADLVDDELDDRYRNVDVFLAGIAGRMFSRNYVRRIITQLAPDVIVPHHYDDFFQPLHAPLGFSRNVNLAKFPEEVAAAARGVEVRTLTPLVAVGATPGA